MKLAISIFITSLFLFSCKKTVENAAENAILNAMTDGQWVVTSFITNGVDITSDFTGYKFQYYADKTVDARNKSPVEWNAWFGAIAYTATTNRQ